MCTKRIKNFQHQLGQSMVELLIAIGLAAVLLPAILTGLISAKEGKAQQVQKTQAVPLLTQAQEAVRSVREKSAIDKTWDTFATNGTYHPLRSGNAWTLAANAETINGVYTRSIVISDVYRNVSGAIVVLGGVIDPSTKRLVSTVSWNTPNPSSVSSTLFITRNINSSYTETTQAQFNAGTTTFVAITNTSGGEVTLGAGGGSDWCNPESEQIPPLDLPKNGVANAISGIQGTLFVGTGENASGVSFAKVNVSSAHPPIATLAETFDGYKTNNVFGDSNYAYLATDNNAKEVVIVDLNNIVSGKYTEAGHVDLPGPRSGNAVSVVGTTGFITSGSKLYSFDLSSMATCNTSGGCPLLDTDGINLAGTGNAMQIIGEYAYIAEGIATNPMQIVNISTPANLQIVGNLTAVNDRWGVDLFVNSTGTRAYLATAQSPTFKEFYIIDTTIKTNPTLVAGGSYETGGTNPKGLVIVPGNRAIIVGQGGIQDYQVVNINDESNPQNCGGMRTFVGINDVAALVTQDGYAYAYILVLENPELHIVEGGPGGIYGLAGTFESQTFDAGSSVAFNSFIKTLATPPSTNATFQFAVADPNPVTGDCTGVTFTYVDPTAGTIPIDDDAAGYENPGRCFRYKVNLSSSDPTQSPVLYDISVNYSL